MSGHFYLIRQRQSGLPPFHGLTADHDRLIARGSPPVQLQGLDGKGSGGKQQDGSDKKGCHAVS